MREIRHTQPLDELATVLRALSDETRQKIVMLFVKHRELSVTEISRRFTLSRPTISHHLAFMKRAKILVTRKEGKEVFYSFNKSYVMKLLRSLLKQFQTCCS